MNWRVAKSLLTFRDQCNTRWPKRNKGADGTIGDTNHQVRTSDHNPWVDDGVVTALDITHDPQMYGPDTYKLAEELRLSRDPRIKYVISKGRIFSSQVHPWVWREYTGVNPHTQHVHISVLPEKRLYDDARPWQLPAFGYYAPKPYIPPPPDIHPTQPPKPGFVFFSTRFWNWVNSLGAK